MYQLTSTTAVVRLSDGAFIPQAPGNRDWDAYLLWARTNTPAPADEPPAPTPPTLSDLQAQLLEIQEQINSLI